MAAVLSFKQSIVPSFKFTHRASSFVVHWTHSAWRTVIQNQVAQGAYLHSKMALELSVPSFKSHAAAFTHG